MLEPVTASATDDFAQTIRARVQTLSSLADTIARNPRATLVPTSGAPPHSGKTARAALEKIRRDPAALRVHETLGQGGMGVVHVGHQVTLDRRVAVKTLRKEHVCDENIESLLGEAWLAGSLEHPNVVPIYDLGLDESGAPLLVMKRIDGDTWSELLSDPRKMSKHATGDTLEFNLRVLVQVCNAIHFAHSRAVIHRDLKPDNVMIGDFGEVYVLDWGVATRPGPVTQVAGTLVYMAPEMLGGMGDIDARTDVYLLGAVLHEIITGNAPHEGANMQAMVSSVILSTPRIPDDAPAELAALVVSCMKRDASERPESALEVRRAIELFLEHRGAMALATQAEERLEELEKILAAPEVEVERAYNVFGECRFGFMQALRAWKDSDVARIGLRRAIAGMVRYEAEHGDARAAALLLAELDEKHPELESLVAAAKKRADDEAEKIEKLRVLEKDNDPREGRQARLAAGLLFGAIWTILPFFAPMSVARWPQYEGYTSIPFSVLTLVILGATRRMWQHTTRINRQMLATFAFAVAMQPAMLFALRWGAHVPGSEVVLVLMVYWTIVFGMLAVAVERRLFPLPMGYAIGFFLAHAFPAYRYDAVAFSNVIAVITCSVIWSRHATERAIAREKQREARGTIC
jgi:serine/threonine-protein kinase